MERHSYEVVSQREDFCETTPFFLQLEFMEPHPRYGDVSCGIVDAENEKILLVETTVRKLL